MQVAGFMGTRLDCAQKATWSFFCLGPEVLNNFGARVLTVFLCTGLCICSAPSGQWKHASLVSVVGCRWSDVVNSFPSYKSTPEFFSLLVLSLGMGNCGKRKRCPPLFFFFCKGHMHQTGCLLFWRQRNVLNMMWMCRILLDPWGPLRGELLHKEVHANKPEVWQWTSYSRFPHLAHVCLVLTVA